MGTLIKSSKYHRSSGEVWDDAGEFVTTEYLYDGRTHTLKFRWDVPIFKRVLKAYGWDIMVTYSNPVKIMLRLA